MEVGLLLVAARFCAGEADGAWRCPYKVLMLVVVVVVVVLAVKVRKGCNIIFVNCCEVIGLAVPLAVSFI